MKYTFYLLKDSVDGFTNVVDREKYPIDKRYTKVAQHEDDEIRYVLFFDFEHPNPAKWRDFFRPVVPQSTLDMLENKVCSFIYLIQLSVDDTNRRRTFAITGGYGHKALNVDLIEPNFGLKVTINSIDRKKSKFCDSRTLDVNPKQKRVISNKLEDLFDLDFDFSQEMLKTISGKVKDPAIGTMMVGSDSLSISTEMQFDTIKTKCLELYKLYNCQDYQEQFQFIDKIVLVNDSQLELLLNTKLFEAIKNRQDDEFISFAYPDLQEFIDCEEIKLSGNKTQEYEAESFSLLDIYEFIYNNEKEWVDLDHISSKIRIHGIDSNGVRTSTKSIISCLNFECEIDGKTYIHTNKKWHIIDSNYYSEIKNALSRYIVVKDNLLSAWHYSQDQREEDYLSNNYGHDDNFIVLDQDFFRKSKGDSKVEVADLFDRTTMRFFCLKKQTKSSSLSHLFSQGSVSATLFKENDLDYMKKFNESTNKKWPGTSYKNKEVTNSTFVYAIATNKQCDIINALPFFSKINLLNHARLIKNYGFNVEITKVEYLV